jgi:TPR repeat protein
MHNQRHTLLHPRYAARQRHRSAEFELGLLYEAGQFVTENPNEAIRLFQRAAASGEVVAMVKLAEYYHDGSVVAGAHPRDGVPACARTPSTVPRSRRDCT